MFTQAQACHADAEILAQTHPSPLDLANTWFGLAQVAFTQHQYAPAEQYCRQALADFEQEAAHKKVSAVYNLFGRIGLENGNYEEAEGYFRQAVALRRVGPRSPLVQMLNNLALALQAQKRFSEAL
ncbi:MAG: tetratricopeptide repeat protein, partial [Anaerolineales bacterium]|nr:tetratricopeptide repeat protein [Anaerolineales bacterium]